MKHMKGFSFWDSAMLERRIERTALLVALRAYAVTTLLREIPHRATSGIDFADRPSDLLVENQIHLRNIGFGGHFYPRFCVHKMRDVAHDRSICEYTLVLKGLRVRSRTESPDGLHRDLAMRRFEQRARRMRPRRPSSDEERE